MERDDEPTCVITNSHEFEAGVEEVVEKNEKVQLRRRGAESLWRVAAAELLGTALLVLLSCLPACAASAAGTDPSPGLLQKALTAGLVVALIVQCFDHISGAQVNPTVTLARALSGRESCARALILCAAQLAGALAGGAALAALAALGPLAARNDCAGAYLTLPAPHVSPYQALMVEAVLGGCLALANLAWWDVCTPPPSPLPPRPRGDSWPLRIGLSVAALTLAAGDVSGASMNPARSFAPALLAWRWEHHWVYWVGPLAGSGLCTALYGCVWHGKLAWARAAPLPRLAPD